VRVEDEDGSAGKRCRIDMKLPGRAFTFEEVDPDLFVAIDRATARAGRATQPSRAA
jgi:hypothetical protein